VARCRPFPDRLSQGRYGERREKGQEDRPGRDSTVFLTIFASCTRRVGLNRTDMRALDIVGSAGSLTPTALARRLGFTTGGITPVIDRLERTGYLRTWSNRWRAVPNP
jgi:hypothetical protein